MKRFNKCWLGSNLLWKLLQYAHLESLAANSTY